MEFSITPLGKGESVSSYVARAVRIVIDSGLKHELHAMGTIVEGEVDQVLRVLQQCFDELAKDCDRVTCSAKFDWRRGQQERLEAKVASVQARLNS
jgi:uncharacterized protein (TIGR00106 family)